jgi:CRP-like cAMP-binding protein
VQAGHFFGERTLLKDEPANATVRTLAGQGAVTCYVCSRESFTAILGPLQALIDAEVRRRDRQAAKQEEPPPLWSDLELRRCGAAPLALRCGGSRGMLRRRRRRWRRRRWRRFPRKGLGGGGAGCKRLPGCRVASASPTRVRVLT